MEQYNTDKYAHGFIDVYEPYFNSMSDSKNILEIGVYYGGSVKYLSDKFKDGIIYGIDIEDKTQYDEDRIKTYVVNQEDRDALNRFLDETNVEFDIIIDDGGHTMKQQQVSFGTLFKRLKKLNIKSCRQNQIGERCPFQESSKRRSKAPRVLFFLQILCIYRRVISSASSNLCCMFNIFRSFDS